MGNLRLALTSVLAATLAVAALILTVAPAYAHDPIFLSADQTTPDTGPYMPDGSISWALYGSVLFEGDTRGFEFDLREGDDLYFSLLIPNLSPELELPDDQLPTVELELPDGSSMQIVPTIREVFDEPFSNTSYVTLAELQEPGMAGRYRGVLTGGAAARFSVAIGVNEIFFTETERSGDRPSNFMEISGPLSAWYSTPPGEEPSTDSLAEGVGEIQMDLIEDAMESGEAQAPEEAVTAADEVLADSEQPVEEVAAEADDALAATTTTDDGRSLTWIAPVALLLILAVTLFVRRSR